jgi:16S rRNA (cytosine967-C5)-methyltransferase
MRRVERLLGWEEARRLFEAYNKKPMLSFRVNTLKASVEEVVEELRREGLSPVVSPRVPTVVKVEGPFRFEKSPLYREGKIVVQEEASAAAALLLSPEPGMTVVDLCAAPGGKTSHLAELMRNKGRIYAFDVDRIRIDRMREVLRRTGTDRIVRIIRADARRAPRILGREVADRVLVDPPCTSTGTIAKNPELRWRLREDAIPEIARLQLELLRAGVELLRPGGLLLYTVCSVLPEEGEEVVERILEENPRLRLVPLDKPYTPSPRLPGTMRSWPHQHQTTGFYYALVKKKEE